MLTLAGADIVADLSKQRRDRTCALVLFSVVHSYIDEGRDQQRGLIFDHGLRSRNTTVRKAVAVYAHGDIIRNPLIYRVLSCF